MGRQWFWNPGYMREKRLSAADLYNLRRYTNSHPSSHWQSLLELWRYYHGPYLYYHRS